MKRLFSSKAIMPRQYYEAQKQSKTWIKGFYGEFIWYMHQPFSEMFRSIALYMIFVPLGASLLQKGLHYEGAVYKRKAQRLQEIRHSNEAGQIVSREEHEMF